MTPDMFDQMMSEIEVIANKYNMQIGFAYHYGDECPEDCFLIRVDFEPKEH